ncbi:MAG TPA: ABC transporter permease [Bryobacteraceae bacterium]|nr:ABC transporter permease [Bryobacteraceae bacterium]
MLTDVRFSLRLLRKSPAFFATAVLSLALGVGATTTVFSAFRAVFLRPLPYDNPDQLVEIVHSTMEGRPASSTLRDIQFFRQFSQSFDGFGTFAFFYAMTMKGGPEPVNVVARAVESDLFPTLRAHPFLGRVFGVADFQNANPRTLLLTFKLWQEQFGGDRGVIGRQVVLDNDNYVIVGVMPPDFQFPTAFSNVLIPDRGITDPRTTARGLIGRLKPGVTAEGARAELERMLPALARQYPEAQRHFHIQVQSLSERDSRKYRAAFLMLCAAVGLLVLIACLNVANLVIARSVARESEFAIRSALGAGRQRLVRQVLVESVVLAAVGGALGTLLAYVGNRALTASLPAHYQVARLGETRIDSGVLLFALGLTIMTAFLFGLGPAVVLSRFSLREMGRTTTQSASRIRWRGALVVSEVALSLMLLIGAGLLIRSFVTLAGVDPGFRADHVLTAMIPAGNQLSKDKPKLVRRLGDIVARVERLPGVTAAGLSTAIPMGTVNVSLLIALPGHQAGELPVNFRAVSTDYFRVMGIPLRLGRLFTPQDEEPASDSIIVNEAFARRYLPGGNPIGESLTGAQNQRIVGVVADQHGSALSVPAEPEFYSPYRKYLGPAIGTMLVVRTEGDPAKIASSVRQAVHQLYPDQPVSEVATMETRLADSMAEPRLYTGLLGIFAGVAIALTAIGICGLVSYSVSHRTRELGIRMALGARPADVLRAVMTSGMGLVALGSVVGLAGAWSLTRYIASLLYGVTPRDSLTFIGAPLLLIAIAAVASYLPARRAIGIDPNVALRQD